MYKNQWKKLIKNIDQMYKYRNQQRDVSETLIKKYYDELGLIITQTSTAIEGNTFTPKETYLFLNDEVTISGKTVREHMEIKGHHKAYHMMLDYCSKNVPITDDFIKNINEFVNLSNDKCPYPNDYRKTSVYIGTRDYVIYKPPGAEQVPQLMDMWINKVNTQIGLNKENLKSGKYDIELILKDVAEHHVSFESIHPFEDGNGRTGRLLTNLELMQYGFFPISFRDKHTYNEALKVYQQSQEKTDDLLKPLMIEVGNGVAESLETWNSRFYDYRKEQGEK